MLKLWLILEAVKELVAESPDAIYCRPKATGSINASCMYTEGTAGKGTGCLLGQAVIKVHPEVGEFLRRVDLGCVYAAKDNSDVIGLDGVNSIGNVISMLGAVEHPDNYKNIRAFNIVQRMQDSGWKWKNALEHGIMK